MKAIGVIPVKERSTRIINKNFRKLGNKTLYENFFEKLYPRNPFDEIYVDTDSQEIKDKAKSYGFNIIDRPKHLTEDNVTGSELLLHVADQIDADAYFQMHVTAPHLKEETIFKAYNELISNQDIDSVLTAREHNSYFWKDGSPTNYDPSNLQRTQDIEPLIEETTGLYGITRESLINRQSRIGENPCFIYVDQVEAIDVDEVEDLKIANILENVDYL
jgi:N-acylneuraminate cytidylyltransferase